jgi:hypothetical protein
MEAGASTALVWRLVMYMSTLVAVTPTTTATAYNRVVSNVTVTYKKNCSTNERARMRAGTHGENMGKQVKDGDSGRRALYPALDLHV